MGGVYYPHIQEKENIMKKFLITWLKEPIEAIVKAHYTPDITEKEMQSIVADEICKNPSAYQTVKELKENK